MRVILHNNSTQRLFLHLHTQQLHRNQWPVLQLYPIESELNIIIIEYNHIPLLPFLTISAHTPFSILVHITTALSLLAVTRLLPPDESTISLSSLFPSSSSQPFLGCQCTEWTQSSCPDRTAWIWTRNDKTVEHSTQNRITFNYLCCITHFSDH